MALSRALRAAAASRPATGSADGPGEAAGAELEAAGIRAGVPGGARRRRPRAGGVQNGRPVLVAVAAKLGDARLIDNVLIDPERLKTEARMQRQMLKIKIHRATVTDCDVDYVGSITIDTDLMAGADLLANEQVHVWDVDTGARFVTYVHRGRGRLGHDPGEWRRGAPDPAGSQGDRRLVRRV